MRSGRRLVVLVSGAGTNLGAIIESIESGSLDADLVAVVSNLSEAGGLERAKRAGVPTFVVAPELGEARPDYDDRLAEVLDALSPDLVVLAGWMRILTNGFCGLFPLINLHPALPGQFPGLNSIERAYKAWQEGEITGSGVMVHWVPDGEVDDGPVIKSEALAFKDSETLETYETRVHDLEHRLIVEAIKEVLQ